MDARPFDVVKVEKARSLRRYRRNQRLKAFLRVSEICAALFLLAYYSPGISLSAAVASDSLSRVVAFFAKPLSVFLLSNSIIITVIVLSGKDTERCPAHDVYDEYVAHRRTFSRNSPATETLPDEETVVNKQIVLYSSAPARENPAPSVMDPDADRDKAIVQVTETNQDGVEKLPMAPPAKQCGRTQKMVTPKVHGELRLSPSGSHYGRHDRAARHRRPCTVEELSDEDFNRRVEKYIDRTRMFLREEKMADAMKGSYKTNGYHSV